MDESPDFKQGVAALHKAVSFLARREHSQAELRWKLAARSYSDKEVEEVLQRLVEKGLQSDQRFTESYVQSRFNRGHGPEKIAMELGQKGIDILQIEEILYSGEFDWCELVAEVYRKKFADKPAPDYKEKVKRSRFLRQRGFSGEQIQSVLGDFNA